MRHVKITSNNKDYIVRRYTDYVLSRMDDIEILENFKDYFFREKIGYPIDTLETAINKSCPEIIEAHISEEVVGKAAEGC